MILKLLYVDLRIKHIRKHTVDDGRRVSLSENGVNNMESGGSLVVQWIGICLSVQGAQARSLVREDPTCCEEAGPMHHY